MCTSWYARLPTTSAPLSRKRAGSLTLDLGASSSVIEADAHHLSNVITNLIDNANKYSPEQPTVTVRTQSATDGITVSVIDRGMGMRKRDRSKYF